MREAHAVLLAILLLGALQQIAPSAEVPADGTPRQPGSAEDRYEARDPLALTIPRRPVTRKCYVDFVRPFAKSYEMTPQADAWGWRHGPLRLMPPLAVFALEGNRGLGERIKCDLRTFAAWVDQSVAERGVVFCLDAATFSALCIAELRKHSMLTPEDERWVRAMLLKIRKHHPAWAEGGGWDGWFRGSQHRSQAQGINNALAAFLYPNEPEAPEWRKLADVIWRDWWDYRDVGINDMWYFHSSLGNILRAAHVMGRKEVFTDPQSRQLFDRILWETTPEGAEVPYGASCGYNAVAGSRIFALELAARHTGDGRYRWAAHRLMNGCQVRGFYDRHPLASKGVADLAVASLVCDDSIQPVEPERGSKFLTRKEIVRLTDPQARAMFPGFGGVDCNMFMTQKVMPHKLAFRSGWAPGDLFMLVECYPRHDPLNPTAIVGLERYGASLAEMASEKFISRENAVSIVDLSGTAAYLGQKGFRGEKRLPVGHAGMETAVPAFSDHALATHATVAVSNYMGFRATQQREFLFVKNRFVLVRDETRFDDRFRASVGPAWNTQHVGQPRGDHWLNTWFTAHFFEDKRLFDVPPWDLLIWYAPRPGAGLEVGEPAEKSPAGSKLVATRYAWQGDVEPGARIQSVTVLLPHAPLRDASSLAIGIKPLADRPGLAAVEIAQDGRCELAVLNPEGGKIELNCAAARPVITDGRAVYIDLGGGPSRRAVVVQGTTLKVGAEELLRADERKNFEIAP